MNEIWNAIKTVAESNGGYFTTRQLEESGISRVHLKTYVDNSRLIRVGHGQYSLSTSLPDEFALLQSRSHTLIFSYGTAMYLWEMTDRIPHSYDVTVPSGTNVSRIVRDYPDLRIHYIRKELYDIGITETDSPMGGKVRLYDKERCICDLISNKKNQDMQLYSGAIKEYFSSRPDIRKLLKYGKQFKIEEMIRAYSEVLL